MHAFIYLFLLGGNEIARLLVMFMGSEVFPLSVSDLTLPKGSSMFYGVMKFLYIFGNKSKDCSGGMFKQLCSQQQTDISFSLSLSHM